MIELADFLGEEKLVNEYKTDYEMMKPGLMNQRGTESGLSGILIMMGHLWVQAKRTRENLS